MPPKPSKIGIVVLNYNGAQDTIACLESLRKARGGDRRVWVVDNASTDGSADILPGALADGETFIEAGSNLGYAGGNNLGIRAALEWGAEYVLILNPDLVVEPDFLPYLIKALESVPSAGVACAMGIDMDSGAVQSLGGSFSLWTGRAKRRLHGKPDEVEGTESWAEVDFPVGHCMLIRRKFMEEKGLLNDAYFLYYEDVELGLRASRAGWKCLAIARSRVRHRDTTGDGKGSPVVTFHGTRNQAWVVREYGNAFQRLTFAVLSLGIRWPVKFAARALRGRFRAAWAVVRGARAGLFSSGWRDGVHLAVPRAGRRVDFEPLP
jgi:GT2 family glycosyltransferase